MGALVIDAFEFCRRNERLEGEAGTKDFPRLAADLADGSGRLRWVLQGGKNALGHPGLSLTVQGEVKLVCQRCLIPFDFVIDSESELVVAADEAAADEIDALLADDEVEVIVGSQSLDAGVLIEDEALLALPISPKHAECPAGRAAGSVEQEKRQSPFSVLRDFKRDN